MELPRVWCLRHPLTQHVPRAVSGTGVYRYRSKTKLIGWWHQTKKTAHALVIPFQRYKRLQIVTVPVILTFLRYMHIHFCYRCRSKHSRRSPIQILTGPDAAWLFWRRQSKALTQQVIAGPNAVAHFFSFAICEKNDFSRSSDDYHWREQRLDYRIGK